MKTVNYLGQDYEVPDRANYIAADYDLEVSWYENEPTRCDDVWLDNTTDAADWGRAGEIKNLQFPLLKI